MSDPNSNLRRRAEQLIDRPPDLRREELVRTFAEGTAVKQSLGDAELARVVVGKNVMRCLESRRTELTHWA